MKQCVFDELLSWEEQQEGVITNVWRISGSLNLYVNVGNPSYAGI
jgi:hypothetical protein